MTRPMAMLKKGRTNALSSTAASAWHRVGLVAIFALIASVGFAAYAGYGRLVHGPANGYLTQPARVFIPPTLWVRSTHAITDRNAPDEMSAWLSRVGDLAMTAAIIVFGDMAIAVASP